MHNVLCLALARENFVALIFHHTQEAETFYEMFKFFSSIEKIIKKCIDSHSVGYDVLNPVSVDDVLIESHVSMCRSHRQFVASHDRVALEHEAWELVVIHFVKPLALLRVLEKMKKKSLDE